MVLIVLCGASIMKPMRFNKEKRLREAAVKERLISIRQAEEKYKAQTGAYTGDFATLVDAGLLADSMRYVPFSGGKVFTLGATAEVNSQGQDITLMECGATYDVYLQGLDPNDIAELQEDAEAKEQYPGLRIGNLEHPNGNAGNWE